MRGRYHTISIFQADSPVPRTRARPAIMSPPSVGISRVFDRVPNVSAVG